MYNPGGCVKESNELDFKPDPSRSQPIQPPEEPFLEWHETTCQHEIERLSLSDGSDITERKLKSVLKKSTGTSSLSAGEKILRKLARGMTSESPDARLNDVSTLLPTLGPKDPTEALLLGQFLTLQDSAMKCLRLANLPDQGFYHEERLFQLAQKLLNTANQTIQTFLKYRSGGQQTVQVVHVHNEGQAIVTQNLSPAREGSKEKI